MTGADSASDSAQRVPWRPGVRLGVDVGTVRIGIARSDPAGLLAVPVETVRRQPDESAALARIVRLAREHEAVEVVVGDPVRLTGQPGPAALAARAFAARIAAELPDLAVRLVDERMTTVAAQRALRAGGRTTRRSRDVIDQAAAVVLVQDLLDSRHSGGGPIGTLLQG